MSRACRISSYAAVCLALGASIVRAQGSQLTPAQAAPAAQPAPAVPSGSELAPANAGTLPAPPSTPGAMPWSAEAAKAAPPPGFLDTTDRRLRAERPPPTEQEIKALGQLDKEVTKFTK